MVPVSESVISIVPVGVGGGVIVRVRVGGMVPDNETSKEPLYEAV